MRKSILIFGLMALSLASCSATFAQDAASAKQEEAKPSEAPAHFYHLDLVVEQVGADGKPTNSRTYATTINTGREDFPSIRTGSKIPIEVGSGKDGGGAQWQYQDIGVGIDARQARDVGNRLSLFLSADVSSVAESAGALATVHPAVNENKWQGHVLIPIGKATVVFSSDNLNDKGAMRLVVTATPLQ